MNDKPTFEELLRESMRRREHSLTEHPTPEELVQYGQGGLPANAAEVILRHLGLCTECTDQLLFYCDFPSSRESPASRALDHLRRRLDALAGWLWPSDRLVWNLARGAVGVAAALMFIAPSVRLHQARQLIAELSRPQPNLEIFHVSRSLRGLEASGIDIATYDVGPEDRFFTVAIPLEGDFEAYQVRILDSHRREVWKSQDLRPDPLGFQLRVGLSRHYLAPGEYSIEISGLEDGTPVSARLYPVRFNYS